MRKNLKHANSVKDKLVKTEALFADIAYVDEVMVEDYLCAALN